MKPTTFFLFAIPGSMAACWGDNGGRDLWNDRTAKDAVGWVESACRTNGGMFTGWYSESNFPSKQQALCKQIVTYDVCTSA